MSIEIFTRRGCPACPAVLAYCEKRFGEFAWINCDSADGLELARARGVVSTPPAIFYDSDGNERARYHSVSELKAAMEAQEAREAADGV